MDGFSKNVLCPGIHRSERMHCVPWEKFQIQVALFKFCVFFDKNVVGIQQPIPNEVFGVCWENGKNDIIQKEEIR